MKNSAGMKTPRREEPYLSDALKAKLEKEVIPRYPTRRAATLPVLHAVQHEHNWLPQQALEEVAEFVGTSAAEVMDTATFYDEFFLQPRGEHTIWVCQSISCELLGHEKIIDKCREKLGVELGETTADGKVTLMQVECLGACGYGPCALVDEELHEHLTPENFERVIDSLE